MEGHLKLCPAPYLLPAGFSLWLNHIQEGPYAGITGEGLSWLFSIPTCLDVLAPSQSHSPPLSLCPAVDSLCRVLLPSGF